MSLDANKCSAVRAEMRIVSEAPLLGTWNDGEEAAAPEAKGKEDEAHDP